MKYRYGIPKQVTILGRHFKISFKDKLENGYMGLCEANELLILIVKDRAEMRRTFLHEVIHATFRALSMEQTSIHPDIEEIIAENVAKVMEPILY